MTAPVSFSHAKVLPSRLTSWPALWTLGVFVICAWMLPSAGFAQSPPSLLSQKPEAAAASPAASATNKPRSPSAGTPQGKLPVTTTGSGPSWGELTAMQQQALKPLALSWNTISEAQKRKWLEISKNYPALSPANQATMHSRMNEWVTLSPQQRAQARLNFAKTKELSRQLTPEEKTAKWQSYQALSTEEKQRLAAKAPPKAVGAATAVKPVAPQKLATLPKSPAPASPGASVAQPPPLPAGVVPDGAAPAAR